MNPPTADPHQPGCYEVRLHGRLDARWSGWFDEMTSTTETSGPDGAITVLRGHLVDQAALHGLLARLRDIGLPLISVARVVPEHAEERDCAGGSPPSAGPAPSDPSRRPHPLPTDT